MHPILLALKPIAANIAKTLVMRKVKKEITREIKSITNGSPEVIEFVDKVETAVVSKKKVSAWASVGIALAYYLSSTGTITPELALLVDSLLTNVNVLQLIESSVE